MRKLTLEKEEGIDGITVYKVFFGVQCLRREEEIKENAQKCADGRSVAETRATVYYEECLKLVNEGYPKVTVLASQDVNPDDLKDIKLGQEN